MSPSTAMSTEDVLVRGQNLHLSFGPANARKTVLSNINLQLQRNQIVTLIGPNGAGKTSLVKVVLGLQAPTSGVIERQQNLRIGYMPQKLHMDTSLPLSVQRFLQLAQKDDHAIGMNLELTGVGHLRHTSMHNLSGGEFQRVLLARALLRNPNLLVLDEPVQGVDVAGQSRLYQLISDIRDQYQCGVLMVSHDLHLVMAATDEVICLNQHVCCHGHPANVSEDPAYLELFGHSAASGVAVYTHHHDHDHDMHGDITDCDAHSCTHEDHHHG